MLFVTNLSARLCVSGNEEIVAADRLASFLQVRTGQIDPAICTAVR
jgi:hypothetical protein